MDSLPNLEPQIPTLEPASTPPALPASSPPKKSPPRLFRLLLILGAIVIALTLAAGVSAAVYLLPSNDPLVRSVASKIPYPIAVVDTSPISFRAFYDEQAAFEQYLQSSGQPNAAENLASMQEEILDAMIDRVLIEQVAADYQVALDQKQIDEFLSMAYAQSGSPEAFLKEIDATFGWKEQEFLDHVVKPIVLASQVREAVFADADAQSASRAQAADYAARLQGGEAFADVFASTELELNVEGGEWGYMKLDEMPEAWRAMVPTLELNAASEPIELPDAFAVLVVKEKIEAGVDTQYDMQVLIVMKRGIEQVMDEYRANTRIWRFLKA